MSTAGYLQDAKNQQKRLAETITSKGITATVTEKYKDLVDKVAQIEELKGEERTLENFTDALDKPESVVQLEYPEPKNLFDKSTLMLNSGASELIQTINGFAFKTTATDKTISATSTIYLSTGTYYCSGSVACSDTGYKGGWGVYDAENKQFIINNAYKGTIADKFTITESKIYQLNFYAPYAAPVGVTMAFENVQLEKGTTATPYEPYPTPKNINAQLSSTNLFDPTTLLSVKHTEDEEAYIFQANVLFQTKNLTPNIKFKEKTIYTLRYTSKQAPNTGSTALPYPRLQIYYTDGTSDLAQTTTDYKTITLQSNKSKTIAYIGSGYSTNGLFYIKKDSIQLIEGTQSELSNYTPYISDFSTVKVTGCGKNFLDIDSIARDIVAKNPTTCEITEFDGKRCLKIGNTSSAIKYAVQTQMPLYSLQLKVYSVDYRASFMLYTKNDTGETPQYISPSKTNQWESITRAFSYDSGYFTKIGFYKEDASKPVYLDLDSVMLETSRTPTPYEPYQGQSYTPNVTGEVTGITALYPTTTLLTDNAGVLFEQVLQGTKGNNFIEILPSTGKNGIIKIKQPIIDSSVDDNIKPENIKKGIKILGILGTYEGN